MSREIKEYVWMVELCEGCNTGGKHSRFILVHLGHARVAAVTAKKAIDKVLLVAKECWKGNIIVGSVHCESPIEIDLVKIENWK